MAEHYSVHPEFRQEIVEHFFVYLRRDQFELDANLSEKIVIFPKDRPPIFFEDPVNVFRMCALKSALQINP